MIKVVFFGSIADKLSKRECLLTVDGGMSLQDVVNRVECGGFLPLLVAVNQEQVNDMNRLMNDGDEVAMMPPFSGG